MRNLARTMMCLCVLTLAFANFAVVAQRRVPRIFRPERNQPATASTPTPAPRNRLDTEPHTDFISPRLVDVSARTSSNYAMRDTYWVKKN